MTKFDFHKAMKFVFKWEGGFVDHPNDPGGATNYGISSVHHNLTYDEVKNLTPEQAKEIYYEQYWLAAGCDQMRWPMNLIVFDTAVNMGVSRAKSFLNPADITPDDYISARMRYYISLDELWPSFGRGWMNRMQDLLEFAEFGESKQDFSIVQVFEGDSEVTYYPVAQSVGRTNAGNPKLMIRIEPRTFLEKLRALFS